MATIRFGTTCSPGRTGFDDRPLQQAEENEAKSNCDPDKLVQCPYDKNHQIRVCRFPYHIIKCRKNHPKLAKELKACPFNARHLVPKHELASHTETCEDRVSLNTEIDENLNGQRNWHVPVSTWVNPNASEDWDKEADDAAAPFVWGVNPMMNDVMNARPANNSSASFKSPRTLPWSN